MTILITIIAYFLLLTAYSRWATGRAHDNDTFFRGRRQSPWYMVAFGMVGASISGVTFVSVPGMVNSIGMTYMQTCLGFILGYVAVAMVLLPVYYRLRLTTIYSFLDRRLGTEAYQTGAWFFLLSKMSGAAVRFYVVCFILQRYVLDTLGVPFWITVPVLVTLIWLYTRRGGIRTLVWTDTLQTTCMFAALFLIVWHVTEALGMSLGEAVTAVANDARSQWFELDDPSSRQYFWKQFVSGIFIVIVMTGLDQDMMQKNLTCRTLHDAQKDMCTYGLAFVPANLLFLALGVLLSLLAAREGLPLPATGDELLPMFAASGRLGQSVVVCFTIGILAASFSSADSALTALTTSYCVDIRRKADDEGLRRRVHLMMAIVFTLLILVVGALHSDSVIDLIYTLCSYTYGPLLGLFAFAFYTEWQERHTAQASNERHGKTRQWQVPLVCVTAPLICYALDCWAAGAFDYHFGYELLIINGLLTFIGLLSTHGRSARQG
ncbi:MAG: sodium:solute symporter [Prevotella sp.]|nr:sodium:solute symporter [Prevotella sp.]